ncbi:MAG: sortase [Eubacteriaceae bacterium]|nr:sortase [Eubacteriaceae bacterium]
MSTDKYRNYKRQVGRNLAAALLAFLLAALLQPSAASASAGATITVKQAFSNTGESPPPSAEFSYMLKACDAFSPMPPDSTGGVYAFALDGTTGKDIFIPYSQTGIYEYEFILLSDASPGYTLDEKAYSIKIIVDSSLSATIAIRTGDGLKAEEISYSHSYCAVLEPSDPGLMFDPPVVKSVSGEPATASVFSFRLTAADAASPMPQGSTNGVKIATISGSGQAYFGTWSYERPGVYYYYVDEVNTGEEGYSYDASVYTITDIATEVDGRLEVNRVIANNANRNVSSLSFINTYRPSQKPPIDEETPNTKPPVDGPKTGDISKAETLSLIFCIFACLALGSSYRLISKNTQPEWRLSKATRSFQAKKNRNSGACLLLVASLSVMAATGYMLYRVWQYDQACSAAYDYMAALMRSDSAIVRELSSSSAQSSESKGEMAKADASLSAFNLGIGFARLTEMYPDIRAWLVCPNTIIDYPVVWASDYSYYLNRLADGSFNSNGSLFIDYNNPSDFTGKLSVVYGHNMKSGRMFGTLTNYKSQAYFNAHPYFCLYTANGNYRIDLLYGCVIGAGQWRERAFMYEENVASLMAFAKENTTFKSQSEYSSDDKIVVLSTCSYEFDDARYILIGVLRPE